MKLAFSTLGCPDWTVSQIVEAARRLGYDGVELRAVSGSLDLLSRPEFAAKQIGTTRALFKDHGVEICCVDTSCVFHSPELSERVEQVELALRGAELAAQLAAPLIRVFPDKIQTGSTREEKGGQITEHPGRNETKLHDGVEGGVV